MTSLNDRLVLELILQGISEVQDVDMVIIMAVSKGKDIQRCVEKNKKTACLTVFTEARAGPLTPAKIMLGAWILVYKGVWKRCCHCRWCRIYMGRLAWLNTGGTVHCPGRWLGHGCAGLALIS